MVLPSLYLLLLEVHVAPPTQRLAVIPLFYAILDPCLMSQHT